ncbi:general vesicular transport factor p115-like [Styela clava]
MNYFKSFVKGSDEQQPSGAETVSRLCDRVASSTLLEDRRDAVRALKSLSRKFRYEVGTQGMAHIATVLDQDANDDEMVAYALDTLCNLMSDMEEDDDVVPQPELTRTFVEKFTAEENNINVVLDFVERYDFSVRLSALRLMISLLKGQPGKIQETVLMKPMGISRLIDLLTDSREVIRNDALLLLIELTRGNSNIQKIIAFENGFDIILDIIRAEGMSDGGVVVEDCLLLLLHLLKRNTSNQQFFKEGSFVQRLTPFFEIDSESVWSAQKVANLHLMLKLVRTLVAPSNPSNVTSSCQLVMQQCGLLERLCNMLMATGVPADILTETINTVSEVIRGCEANQAMFESVHAPCEPPRPAIVVLLMSMVNDKQPFELRCAVLYCFQCFLHVNPAGQTKIVNTLLPSSLQSQQISAGQLLCGGLFAASDPLSNWCSAVALSHALNRNTEMKQQLLRVQLATSVGNPPISLLQQITNIVRQSTSIQSRMGLLILLCSWLSGCPIAVSHLLHDSDAVPFLLSQIAEHGNELDHVLHGVCALLLGICIVDNDGSVPQCTKESLIELIVARVGIERFCDSLGAVTKHDLYSKAFQRSQPVAPSSDDMLFDHNFTKLFKTLEDNIIKMVSNLEDVKKEEESKAAIKAHDSIIKEYQALIRSQDTDLKELRSRVSSLESELSQTKENLDERTAQVQQLKDQYNVLKTMHDSSSGDGVSDAAELLSSLNVQIEELKQENAEKNAKLQEKENSIQQLRNDLDGLELRSLQLSSSDETQQNNNQQSNTNIPDDSIHAINVPDDSRLQEHRLVQLTNEVDSLRSQLQAKDEEISRLLSEGARSQNTTDEVYDVLVSEKTSMQTKIHDLESRLNVTSQENLTLQDKISTLEEKLSNLQSKEESLVQQVTDANSKAEEAKAQAEDFKKEQEDLLILLSDQETKLESYKTKIKTLGGEISDEDDDEEEEDDEEDEDVIESLKQNSQPGDTNGVNTHPE